MQPSEAIRSLLAQGMTEAVIAARVGATQPTINRIRRGQQPSYPLGKALVELAETLPPEPEGQGEATEAA